MSKYRNDSQLKKFSSQCTPFIQKEDLSGMAHFSLQIDIMARFWVIYIRSKHELLQQATNIKKWAVKDRPILTMIRIIFTTI